MAERASRAVYCVTGAASGIGAATAAQLREQGHTVIGVDLRDCDIEADLASAAGRAHAVAEIRARCAGRLSGLVTAAGIGPSTVDRGARLTAVNFFGSVGLVQALRPELAAAGAALAETAGASAEPAAEGMPAPAVVCVGSNAATCQPGWPLELARACLAGDEAEALALADTDVSLPAYAATKAAIAWWVRSRAHTSDWAGAGIRLNAIAPGLIETPLVERQRSDPFLGPALANFPIPRGRGGTAAEVAEVICFLLSPAASLLYGSVIVADGGTEAMLRATDWPALWNPALANLETR